VGIGQSVNGRFWSAISNGSECVDWLPGEVTGWSGGRRFAHRSALL